MGPPPLSHTNRLLITIHYPYEKSITSKRFLGRIHFEFDKCIACEVCVRVCPIDLPLWIRDLKRILKENNCLTFRADLVTRDPGRIEGKLVHFSLNPLQSSRDPLVTKSILTGENLGDTVADGLTTPL
jgi:ferredoxin